MRMEEENSREAAEKLQQIGSSILGAARDELYLGMRFLDVALSSFVYQMDSSCLLYTSLGIEYCGCTCLCNGIS